MSDVDCVLALPDEVLVQLFSCLSQKQLGTVSTVSRCWRSAALVALNSLHLEITNHNYAELPCWLKHRAKQLQHLRLTHDLLALPIQLPFSNTMQLRSLALEYGVLNSAAYQVLYMLQLSLTSLRLCSVEANSYSKLLDSIAVLGRLQNLTIAASNWDPGVTGEDRKAFVEAANSVWCSLQNLTSLTFAGCHADDVTVREITRLTNLQHLDLIGGQISKPETLASLPASLTYLNVAYNHQQLDCSNIIVQTPLPALQHLDISSITLSRPSQLTTLTKLEALLMAFAVVHHVHEFLSVLPQLSNLRQLELSGVFGYLGSSGIAAVEGVLAQDLDHALQLPHLTSLDFAYNQIIPPHPGAAGQPAAPMLFTGWHLPELLTLDLGAQATWTAEHEVLCRVQELTLLAKKFPKLCHLDLRYRVQLVLSTEGLHSLQQLTGLTCLRMGGIRNRWQPDDAGLKVLALMTSLKELWLCDAVHVTDSGLASLTKLTGLTFLYISVLQADKLSPQITSCDQVLHLTFKGSKQVWQQLSHRLRNSPVFLKERQKELERELKAAKKEAAAERKRAAAAKREVAAAQKELAALRQQLEELRASVSYD